MLRGSGNYIIWILNEDVKNVLFGEENIWNEVMEWVGK